MTRLAAIVVAMVFAVTAQATTYYNYDNLGRVTQVTESDGSTTQYTYDANGNTTSISRAAGSSVFSVGSISVSSGSVGSSVTINGSGFSSIAGQDTVTFNGVTAQVTYASDNRIVVTVPDGATSGDITVTSPNGSITSNAPFTVVPVSIAAFRPTIGTAGTVVTITGGGFDATASNDVVTLNGTPGSVSSATPTQMQFTVPSSATSGHLSVTTPRGVAVSVDDFLVPASGYTVANIAAFGALVPGGPARVFTTNAVGQVAVALFDGAPGQMVTLILTNVSVKGIYQVLAPDGSVLTSDELLGGGVIYLPALSLAGTYSLYLIPSVTAGSATVAVQTDVVGTLPTDGTPKPTSLARGQDATYTFSGVAGQSYSLQLTQFSSSYDQGRVTASILKPDGTPQAQCGSYVNYANPPGNCDFTLTTSGTYSVHLVSAFLSTYSFNVLLSQDFAATLTAGTPGPAVNINLVAGQHASLKFTATAGQSLALYLGSVAITPTGANVSLSIYAPNGASLSPNPTTVGNASSTTLNLTNLVAGTYTVLITPNNYNGAPSSMQVVLANAVMAALPVDGSTATFHTYVPGQYGYFTFVGTAGQDLGFAVTQLTLTPNSSTYASITVNNPDGTSLTPATCYMSSRPGCQVSLTNLPQSGTYSILVRPSGQATMAFALTVSPDVIGTLALNSTSTITLSSPGETAALTFTASAGQALLLDVGSLTTTPASGAVVFYVYDSSGNLVLNDSLTASGAINLGILAAGTYTLRIVPNSALTAALQVALKAAPNGALSNGTSLAFATTIAGQASYLTFTGTAGQSASLALTSLSLAPNSVTSVTVRVSKPDGTLLTVYQPGSNPGTTQNCAASSPGCELHLLNIPATGTYTVAVSPSGQATMNFMATFSQDQSGTLSSGTAFAVNLAYLGQSATLTFALASQHWADLVFSAISAIPANTTLYAYLYDASGTSVASTSGTGGAILKLASLAAGTYTVVILPSYPATSEMQVMLDAGTGPPLAMDGSTNSYATTVLRDDYFLYFSGTAGENVGLGVTGLVLTPNTGDGAYMSVYQPGGTDGWKGVFCRPDDPGGGCQLSLLNLPTTGIYTVQIWSRSQQQTLSFNFTGSKNVTGILALNTPQSVSLVPGQDTALSFTATAGQTVAVSASSIVTTPANQSVALTIYDASNTSEGNISGTGGAALNLTNLAAGTYTVVIVPNYAAAATMQVTIQ